MGWERGEEERRDDNIVIDRRRWRREQDILVLSCTAEEVGGWRAWLLSLLARGSVVQKDRAIPARSKRKRVCVVLCKPSACAFVGFFFLSF